MSPDIKPNNSQGLEAVRTFVDKPKRTDKPAKEDWARDWMANVHVNWSRLTQKAYASLDSQPDAVLRPELLTSNNMRERFRLKKRDIPLHVVTIGVPTDMSQVMNYFEIGKIMYGLGKGEGRIIEVTRAELFQIFIAVLAKVEVVPESRSRKLKRRRLDNKRSRVTEFDISIDQSKLIRERDIVEPAKFEREVGVRQDLMVIVNQKTDIVFRERPPVDDIETQREIDRLMRRKPERGGPMMNVR